MELTATVKTIANPIALVTCTRKNHAIEHATIHLLSTMLPGRRFSGVSLPTGFWIAGVADLEDIRKAAEAGLARLANGETRLAVHPNCGTNIAVTAFISAAASMAVSEFRDDEENNLGDTFSSLLTGGMIGAFTGRSLGPKAQKYVTTDADVRGMSIAGITCHFLRNFTAFYIQTVMNPAAETETNA